jgi:hypothetical protein
MRGKCILCKGWILGRRIKSESRIIHSACYNSWIVRPWTLGG